MDTKQLTVLFAQVILMTCVSGIPRVIPQNGRGNPTATGQMHYKLPSSAFSEKSFIDYKPREAMRSIERPNVCSDCVCGISNRKGKIVGGKMTVAHEFPWIVSINVRKRHNCGGSLITKKHILTAAHCLKGYDIKQMEIVLGQHNKTFQEDTIVRRNIRSATIHEHYDFQQDNDIAIVEMDIPVEFNNVIRPVCLPEYQAIDYFGAMGIAAGWGRLSAGGSLPDALLEVEVPIISDEECRHTGYANTLTENMMCAGYPNGEHDSCQGDSGGPLLVVGKYHKLEIVGIVSWGIGCADPQFPGIYTKVSNYLGWLRDHLDNECVCPPPTSKLPLAAQ